MPTQAPKPCLHPGCGVLVIRGSRCPHHEKAPSAKSLYDLTWRKTNPALAYSKRFRSSGAWTKFSLWFRAQHPLCCDPFGQHMRMPAYVAQVHHVEPLSERPDLGLIESNCRPLCTSCHARVEGMERRGQPTANLFTKLA